MDLTARLDEAALRRPGFHEGVRVELADGQSWAFPRLWHRFVPARDEDTGKIVARARATYGPEHDRDLDLVYGGIEVEPMERMDAIMRLACNLLMANYEIEVEQLADLIPRDDTDDRLREMWQAIMSAMLGLGPKASPVGSE